MPIHVLSTKATTTKGTEIAYMMSMTSTIWAQGKGKGVSAIALRVHSQLMIFPFSILDLSLFYVFLRKCFEPNGSQKPLGAGNNPALSDAASDQNVCWVVKPHIGSRLHCRRLSMSQKSNATTSLSPQS